jgi:hypothetical protein
MTSFLAVRLDYGTTISQHREVAGRIAELLTRPALAVFRRVSARRRDRWQGHALANSRTVQDYLSDPSNDSVALDDGRSGELTASAELQSGPGARAGGPGPTRFRAYLAFPLEAGQLEPVLAAVCDLAATLRIAAGFVTVEPTYGLAQRVALGQSIPKERPGLSEKRIRERRVRDYKSDLIDTRLAGLEWGTFLGPGHLGRVDVGALRKTGAFHRVVEVMPSLVFLQLTANPEDDLSPEIESKLARARETVKSLLLDTDDLPRLPDP